MSEKEVGAKVNLDKLVSLVKRAPNQDKKTSCAKRQCFGLSMCFGPGFWGRESLFPLIVTVMRRMEMSQCINPCHHHYHH